MSRGMRACTPQEREVSLGADQGIGSLLRCPRCGDVRTDCLHHEDVQVFDRGEDDTITDVVAQVDGRLFVGKVPSEWVPNPSSRRTGLRVSFRCEECGDGLWLTIAQHKGSTFLRWRWSTEPDPDKLAW